MRYFTHSLSLIEYIHSSHSVHLNKNIAAIYVYDKELGLLIKPD